MCVCGFSQGPKSWIQKREKTLYNIQINTNYMYIYVCIQIIDLEWLKNISKTWWESHSIDFHRSFGPNPLHRHGPSLKPWMKDGVGWCGQMSVGLLWTARFLPNGTWSSSSAMHSLAPKLAAMLICPMALAAHSTGVCCKIRSWYTSCDKSELVVGTSNPILPQNSSTPNLPLVPPPWTSFSNIIPTFPWV